MIERLLMRLRVRDPISAEEERAIRWTITDVRELRPHQTFIRRNEELDHSTLLIEGLACRYKDLRNGQRQISELHVPGDFADLHSFTLKRLDHQLMSLTPCRIGLASHERIQAVIDEFPRIGRLFWFSTNVDASIHREWALSLGRRTALQRVAHLFCELHMRLGVVGLADDSGFELRITQAELAECLGLTVVHVNRTLRELRERNLMVFRNWRADLTDPAGLRALAEFDPMYLYIA